MVSDFTTKPKKWGNSLGITIPKEIVEKENIGPGKDVRILLLPESNDDLWELSGTVQFDKSTDDIMREIDGGW